MYKVARKLARRSRHVNRVTSRYFYEFLSTLDKHGEVTLMNYGYVPLNKRRRTVALKPEDEQNRYPIQMYHHVAGAVNLSQRDVLEVGSGRGGGASYVSRYLAPRSMTAIDISAKAIAFSHRHHNSGVTYRRGDAEDLPFTGETFDAVVNIESSHCYGQMAGFLSEVYRVLRPGGHLLWADIYPGARQNTLHADVQEAGFRLVKEEDITGNVLAAMALTEDHNRERLERLVPRYARRWVAHFGGLQGTYIHDQLVNGALDYLHLVLRKAA